MENGKQKNKKEEWNTKKKTMLLDKIDVAKFITEFIENYPESIKNYKELPGFNNV